MDLTNLETIRSLLKEFSTTAEKKFGQNFLIDREVLFNLVQSADLDKNDSVIEVGPGIGTVTKELAINSKEVFSFEIDENKIPILDQTLKENNNTVVFNKDFLEINLGDFLKETEIKSYKFVSSLPYHLSKRILQMVLESENKPELISVIIQKEVAENYVPDQGGTFLSNYLKLLGEGKIIMTFGSDSFYPEPKVDSAILQITPRKDTRLDRDLVKFIKNGFHTPRKKLSNVLNSIYRKVNWDTVFKDLGLDTNVRAENLEIETWVKLYKYLKDETDSQT